MPTAISMLRAVHLAVARRAVDQDAVGAGQRRGAGHDGDTVAPQLVLLHPGLGPDDRAHARQQRSGCRPFVVADSSREAVLIGRAMVLSVEGQNRLAEGLGRDGAGMNAHAAHVEAALHDRHPLAQLGGLHGGALTRGPASDADQIEVKLAFHGCRPWPGADCARRPCPSVLFRGPRHRGCGAPLQRDGPDRGPRIRSRPLGRAGQRIASIAPRRRLIRQVVPEPGLVSRGRSSTCADTDSGWPPLWPPSSPRDGQRRLRPARTRGATGSVAPMRTATWPFT